MTNPIADFSKAQVILVTGTNTTENHPIIGSRIRRAVANGTKLLLFEPRQIPLTKIATVWCRQRPGTDVAWINGLLHVILAEHLEDAPFIKDRTEGFEALKETVKKYDPRTVSEITGIPADDIILAARTYASGKPASIAYAMGITQHITGTDNVKSLANLAMLCGNMGVAGGGVNPLRGQNNVQGACDMAALPNVFPGYQKVIDDTARQRFEKAWSSPLPDKPGLTMTEILKAAGDGAIKALYIMGENPMLSDPDLNHVAEEFKSAPFVVVQDLFLTETAKMADVVLPAASYAEREGTVTNTERRVQRFWAATDPLPGTRPDWQILCDLAGRMGQNWQYDSVADIMDEIASVVPQYTGISYERLDRGEQLCWPCPTNDHPGTPILHVGRFSRGLGLFHAVDYIPPAEKPDADYPLILTTGRILAHFHTGTMTRKSEGLNALAPGPFVEVSAEDARKLGIKDGQTVRVRSRRGAVELTARVDSMVDRGILFIPFHFWEAAANVLTNTALDPTAKIPELKVCAARLEKL